MDYFIVVYVARSEHSGSTILDIIHGAHEIVESMGEVEKAPSTMLNPEEFCIPGVPALDCAYWNAIK